MTHTAHDLPATTDLTLRSATETQEGAGARVKRLMPVSGFMNHDPFVLFDHFSILPGAGFPDHPHRGFEAITYLFGGAIRHEDNLGNRSTVTRGGVQRFTAGKGLVHSEMPGIEGITEGIQLWINLPQRLKGLDPAYQQADAADIPEHILDNGLMREIVGPDSPVRLHSDVRYLDVILRKEGEWRWVPPQDHSGFVYVVSGTLDLNQHTLATGQAAFFTAIEELITQATTETRFLVCTGRPHGEPIRQRGPFVD